LSYQPIENYGAIFARLLDEKKGGFFCITPGFTEMKTKQLRITTVRGEVTYRLQCAPRFNYGRDQHKAKQTGPNEILFHADRPNGLNLRLQNIILENAENENTKPEDLTEKTTRILISTINYWKDRVGRSTAAPTFSLPETMGGNRNWDYRYTWIRDASFTVYSFIRLGYSKEAGAFMGWIEKVCREITDKELMDSVYLYNKYGEPISYDFWKDLEQQIEWLSLNWDQQFNDSRNKNINLDEI